MAKNNKPDYSNRINVELGRVPHTYRENSNPAAVGWAWTSDGRDHELVWSRDTNPMTYSIRSAGGRWNTMVTRNPKMENIKTLKEAREVAEWFINGHMLPENDSAYES